jgi:hypothetical protein
MHCVNKIKDYLNSNFNKLKLFTCVTIDYGTCVSIDYGKCKMQLLRNGFNMLKVDS